jgi:hypothetical protein
MVRNMPFQRADFVCKAGIGSVRYEAFGAVYWRSKSLLVATESSGSFCAMFEMFRGLRQLFTCDTKWDVVLWGEISQRIITTALARASQGSQLSTETLSECLRCVSAGAKRSWLALGPNGRSNWVEALCLGPMQAMSKESSFQNRVALSIAKDLVIELSLGQRSSCFGVSLAEHQQCHSLFYQEGHLSKLFFSVVFVWKGFLLDEMAQDQGTLQSVFELTAELLRWNFVSSCNPDSKESLSQFRAWVHDSTLAESTECRLPEDLISLVQGPEGLLALLRSTFHMCSSLTDHMCSSFFDILSRLSLVQGNPEIQASFAFLLTELLPRCPLDWSCALLICINQFWGNYLSQTTFSEKVNPELFKPFLERLIAFTQNLFRVEEAPNTAIQEVMDLWLLLGMKNRSFRLDSKQI